MILPTQVLSDSYILRHFLKLILVMLGNIATGENRATSIFPIDQQQHHDLLVIHLLLHVRVDVPLPKLVQVVAYGNRTAVLVH